MFNYATLFHSQHDTIAPPEQFKLSDSQYRDFISFLQGKNFDYQTSSEADLQDLIQTAKEEQYYQLAQPEFDSLKVKLAHDKNKDLRTFEPEIKELLDEEIVSRYYYQKGKIKCSLRDDPQLDQAVAVLNEPEKYSAILQPGYNVNDTVVAER
jgi:carboxyl-terminal processing protease